MTGTLTPRPSLAVFAAFACFCTLPACSQVPATPILTAKPAHNNAWIVSLSEATAGTILHYTTDGSAPTGNSPQYLAPFLIASATSVQAIAFTSDGTLSSPLGRRDFQLRIAPNTLVWSEEFHAGTTSRTQPDPSIWTYDTGASGYGNQELEDYCAWGSDKSPCDPARPNAWVGSDGYLHIAARQPSPGVYTSARLKTQGLFSFQYGRLEFRMLVPEAKGLWPAGWLLGNSVATVNWPECGEQDVQERVNVATTPDVNFGSIHGPGFTGTAIGEPYHFPAGQTAATWHTYGMIWKPGSIAYYIDDPAKPYVTFTTATLQSHPGARWPFDDGQANFLILNLAVGGQWPGSPDASTPFPSETLVDYIRLYTY